MGSSRNYICPKCGYSAHVCGGREVGMLAVLKTFSCRQCHTLSDIQIGEYGQDYADMIEKIVISPIPVELKCPECNSTNIRPWNPIKRPCPKCGAIMKADPMSEVLWD